MRRALPLLVSLVLVAAACGDDDGNGDGLQPPPLDDGTTEPEPGDDPDADDLDDLFTARTDVPVRVTYQSADDEDELLLAQDGEGNRVFRVGDETAIYELEDRVVTCNDLAGEPQCTELPSDSPFAMGLLPFQFMMWENLTAAGAAPPFTDQRSDSIAGRDARCIVWDVSEIAGLAGGLGEDFEDDDVTGWEVCADEETGIMLRWAGTQADGTRIDAFEATSFGEPTPADFELPADPEPLPDIGDFPGLGDLEGLEDLDLDDLFGENGLDLDDLFGDGDLEGLIDQFGGS